MESIRQNKISRLIQKELADFFQKESGSYFPGKMITVTVVRISGDLSIAKVYLSIYPYNKEEDSVKTINEHVNIIRSFLGKKIRHQVKKIPELVFFRDDSIDYANRIDELLKS